MIPAGESTQVTQEYEQGISAPAPGICELEGSIGQVLQKEGWRRIS